MKTTKRHVVKLSEGKSSVVLSPRSTPEVIYRVTCMMEKRSKIRDNILKLLGIKNDDLLTLITTSYYLLCTAVTNLLRPTR